jgi:hypothetical protein
LNEFGTDIGISRATIRKDRIPTKIIQRFLDLPFNQLISRPLFDYF